MRDVVGDGDGIGDGVAGEGRIPYRPGLSC
jgi:hypothetical protein